MLTDEEIGEFVAKNSLGNIFDRYMKMDKTAAKLAKHTIDAIAREDCVKLEQLVRLGALLSGRDHRYEDAVWEHIYAKIDDIKCGFLNREKARFLCSVDFPEIPREVCERLLSER